MTTESERNSALRIEIASLTASNATLRRWVTLCRDQHKTSESEGLRRLSIKLSEILDETEEKNNGD